MAKSKLTPEQWKLIEERLKAVDKAVAELQAAVKKLTEEPCKTPPASSAARK